MILLAGALDTKAREYEFLREVLHGLGESVLLVDVGVTGSPSVAADITRQAVGAAAGVDVSGSQVLGERAPVLASMAEGLRRIVNDRRHELTGAIAVGGSGAVALVAPAFAELPFGMPRLILTTMAATAAEAVVGSDVIVVSSPVDFAGLNEMTRTSLQQVAAMVVAAAKIPRPQPTGRTVAITMFGVTTVAATAAARALEESGWEVVTFHANGAGGRALERLIDEGRIAAVVDLTTTELTDELLGGKASAGPDRLGAAARAGIPQVLSVGALDIANFGPPESVPAHLADHRTSQHGPLDTLVRIGERDAAQLGRRLAAKAAAATGPVAVILPSAGFSALSERGRIFEDFGADAALLSELAEGLPAAVAIHRVDGPLNTEEFGRRAAQLLLSIAGPAVVATPSSPRSPDPLPVSQIRQLRVIVQADDFEEALSFYRDALGLTEQAAFQSDGDARVVMLRAGAATLELANADQVAMIDALETDGARSPHIRLAFEVDDALAATRTLEAAGGQVIAEPRETPWRSLNARLAGPGQLQITVFEELESLDERAQRPGFGSAATRSSSAQ